MHAGAVEDNICHAALELCPTTIVNAVRLVFFTAQACVFAACGPN